MAGRICAGIQRYDKNILLNFIKSIPDLTVKGRYNKRNTDWGYGIDEIFLN